MPLKIDRYGKVMKMREPIKVLLVEDDPVDRQLFIEAAARQLHPVTVIEAVEGNRALEFLLTCTSLPDVVVVDINMPMMNGIDCLKEIRSNPRLSGVAVVMFSTSKDDRDIARSFAAGATFYSVKPGDFPRLQDVVTLLTVQDWSAARPQTRDNSFLLGSDEPDNKI